MTYEGPEKAATEPTEAMTTAAENFIFLAVFGVKTTTDLDLCAQQKIAVLASFLSLCKTTIDRRDDTKQRIYREKIATDVCHRELRGVAWC
jgi:hypothetical protein